ncbi:MAG: MarR family transcriptional regulator [Lachnospiraceae bacterium]|nr:MarR family transcriptional regulator [Lachnospiraceae bacterium]
MHQQSIGYLMKQITDKMKAAADTDLKKKNLTLSQVRVLEYVSGKGGTVTQKSIEDYLSVSHPTVVGIVSRMEKNGYLVCYVDKDDKRNKVVELTEQASHMAHEVQDEIGLREEKLLQGLTEEEAESLSRMLNIIYKNLD